MKKANRAAALLMCLLIIVSVFAGCSGKLNSVGDYLKQESVQSSLNEEIAALEGSGISMEVYADGNTLVYDCSYDTQIDLSDEATKSLIVESLAAACAEVSSTYTEIAETLRDVIDADDIKVRLIYRNADGSEIYSCEFE